MLMYRHGDVYNFDIAIYTPKSLISYLMDGWVCLLVVKLWFLVSGWVMHNVSCPCDGVVSLCEIVSCTWSYSHPKWGLKPRPHY